MTMRRVQALVVAAAALLSACDKNDAPASPATTSPATVPATGAPAPGSLGTLKISFAVAASASDVMRIVTFEKARDYEGITEMRDADRVFLCLEGTQVRFVRPETNVSEVRILSGEHKGRLGFLPTNTIQPDP